MKKKIGYIEKVLVSLGKEELYSIIKEQGEIKVDCQFCNKKYLFKKEQKLNIPNIVLNY